MEKIMFRAFIAAAVLSAAAPAVAQTSADAPAAVQPEVPAQAQTPADTVASIVDSEFPAYDANGDAQLDKAEFSRWMAALKDQEMKSSGQKLAAADVVAWTDGAFNTADADKSMSVSKPELISYLSRGAS